MTFLRKLLGISEDRYRISALVSSRTLEREFLGAPRAHVICDLDKTYVETEFESWVKMARIPFERPHEKITVPGASEVLQALRVGHETATVGSNAEPSAAESGLHFVSSSPPQLRSALEGKLILDQLDWTSDTFKNQSYNLRMARIDLLRHHIAYKTKAILDVMAVIAPGSSIWMIGDNAEYDGFIYTGIKLFLEGQLDTSGLAGWLATAHVEKAVVSQVIEGVKQTADRQLTFGGIFIRKLPNYPLVHQAPFAEEIYLFDSWFQIAWQWLAVGLIAPNRLWPLVRAFHNLHGVPLGHLFWCLSRVRQNELSSTLNQNIELVLSRLRLMNVEPERGLAWDLLTVKLPISLNLEMDSIVELAGRWYQLIEQGRALRKGQR